MKYLAILILGSILLSCNKDNEIIDVNQYNNCDSLIEFELTDQELFDTAYSDFEYYEGFYTEDLNGGSIYFENTVSVYHSTPWIYLCTDNYNTALNWSEMSSNNSSYYRELISTSENEKYFEFVRVRESNNADILLSRVYKCSYFDPTFEEEVNDSTWILGTFNKQGINEENCLELIEFLYFITSYNSSGTQYIFSQTCESTDYIYVYIYNVGLSRGDWNMKDKISLRKYTNTIDKKTGKVTKYMTLIKQIDGYQN